MKIYIYIMALLLMCSCSITKKASLKVNTELKTEEVKTSTEQSNQSSSIDTSKIVSEVMDITEYVSPTETTNDTKVSKAMPKRVIHYTKTISSKGQTNVNNSQVKEESKTVNIDTKTVVSKKEITQAKAKFPFLDCLTAIAIPVVAFIVLIILFFIDQKKRD